MTEVIMRESELLHFVHGTLVMRVSAKGQNNLAVVGHVWGDAEKKRVFLRGIRG